MSSSTTNSNSSSSSGALPSRLASLSSSLLCYALLPHCTQLDVFALASTNRFWRHLLLEPDAPSGSDAKGVHISPVRRAVEREILLQVCGSDAVHALANSSSASAASATAASSSSSSASSATSSSTSPSAPSAAPLAPPAHPSLSFWLRGCGYRDDADAPISPGGEAYDPFVPHWLSTTTGGVVVTRGLTSGGQTNAWPLNEEEETVPTEWIRPCPELKGQENEEELAPMGVLPPFPAPWHCAPPAAPDRFIPDPATAAPLFESAGTGFAVATANSASSWFRRDLEAAKRGETPEANVLKVAAALQSSLRSSGGVGWSLLRMRLFLHAHESLAGMGRLLSDSGIRGVFGGPFGFPFGEFEEPSLGARMKRSAFACTQLMPVLLPWPRALDGVGDKRPPPPRAPPRRVGFSKEEEATMLEDLLGTMESGVQTEAEWRVMMDAPVNPVLPFHPPLAPAVAIDLGDEPHLHLPQGAATNIATLSSEIKGCPWVFSLPSSFPGGSNVPSHRIAAECHLVAQHVTRLMGRVGTLYLQEDRWKFMAGRRGTLRPPQGHWSRPPTLGEMTMTADRLNESLQGVLFDPAEAPPCVADPAPVLAQLSALLPSSLLVRFRAHTTPWPKMIVAPLAPGWIGGFVAACSHVEY